MIKVKEWVERAYQLFKQHMREGEPYFLTGHFNLRKFKPLEVIGDKIISIKFEPPEYAEIKYVLDICRDYELFHFTNLDTKERAVINNRTSELVCFYNDELEELSGLIQTFERIESCFK